MFLDSASPRSVFPRMGHKSSSLPRLMAKCNPIANYSYPRNDIGHRSSPSSSSSTSSSTSSSSSSKDRSSIDSDESSSPPGLIDDGTDSEGSDSEECQHQHHAHAAKLWNSFWRSDERKRRQRQSRNPALIPPPSKPEPAWPLPEPQPASYHIFPPRTCSKAPMRPQRPPPRLLPLCPPPTDMYLYPSDVRSATHLPARQSACGRCPAHSVRPCRSINHFGLSSSPPPAPIYEVGTVEPRSVFEHDDSDSDDSDSSPTLAFFRFHKRGESRSTAKSSRQSIDQQTNASAAPAHRRHPSAREGSCDAGASATPLERVRERDGQEQAWTVAEARCESSARALPPPPPPCAKPRQAVLSRMLRRKK